MPSAVAAPSARKRSNWQWLLLLLLMVAPGIANAATLTLVCGRPRTNQFGNTCFTQTDSGLAYLSGTPLTDLRGILFHFQNFADPADTLNYLVPDTGSDTLGISIEIKDGTMGSVRAWSVDTSDNRSCLSVEYVFAFPATEPPPPLPPGSGVRGEYYSYDRWHDFKSFLFERTDTTIDFDWGTGAACPTCPVDYWSVRWTGSINIPTAGLYTFSIDHQDGVRFTLDATLLQNYWSDQSAETSCSIQLPVGPHPFMLEFYTGYSRARCRLSWTGPGIPKAPLPSWAFSK